MKTCSVCGESFPQEGHYDDWNWKRNAQERRCNKPGCKKKGADVKPCSVCGESFPKEGHYNDRNWKASNAKRKCNKPSCTKSQAKRGMWQCVACEAFRGRENSASDSQLTKEIMALMRYTNVLTYIHGMTDESPHVETCHTTAGGREKDEGGRRGAAETGLRSPFLEQIPTGVPHRLRSVSCGVHSWSRYRQGCHSVQRPLATQIPIP